MADATVRVETNVSVPQHRRRKAQYNGYFWSGGVIVIVLIAGSLLAPFLGLHNPNSMDVITNLSPIGTKDHPLGTDNYGRDMVSRLLYGGQATMLVGVASSFLSTAVGVFLGIAAGYWGKSVDIVVMRSMDILMSFPFILLAILIVAFAGPSTFHALLAIAVANLPFFARVVRSEVIKLKVSEYITAARSVGAGDLWIISRHIFPNVLPYVMSTLFMNVGWMISQTSALSFLGFGTQPPRADWGSMLAEAQTYMALRPGVAVLPGVMIAIAVVGFNLFGIGLKSVLLKESRH